MLKKIATSTIVGFLIGGIFRVFIVSWEGNLSYFDFKGWFIVGGLLGASIGFTLGIIWAAIKNG